MAKEIERILSQIKLNEREMLDLVSRWSCINTYTFNLKGGNIFIKELKKEFGKFGYAMKEITLPDVENINDQGEVEKRKIGRGLSIRKKTRARKSIYLGIHYDTVYSPDSPFQKAGKIHNNRIEGPGVADAKGGIVVLLTALKLFEKSPFAQKLNWEVFLNPDEEIGSPRSREFLKKCATRNDLGLIFEPCLPDGSLIAPRGGSAFFTLMVKGRSAHVGRDFHNGRNAFHFLSRFIVEMERMAKRKRGIIFNVGTISGGGPVNVVADFAICRFNIRIASNMDPDKIKEDVLKLIHSISGDDVQFELAGDFQSKPKPITRENRKMLIFLKKGARFIGFDLNWQGSNGVCDGNKLQSYGLPVIDTLGPCGGNLHSPQEYLVVDSMAQRVKLVLYLLMGYACEDFTL